MSEEEVDPKNIVDAVVKVYVNGINQMLSQEQSLEAKIKGEKHVVNFYFSLHAIPYFQNLVWYMLALKIR